MPDKSQLEATGGGVLEETGPAAHGPPESSVPAGPPDSRAVPLRGVAAFLFCALSGLLIVTVCALFLYVSLDDRGRPLGETSRVAPVSLETAPAPPPPSAAIQHRPRAPRSGAIRATVQVSDLKPRLGRTVRITLVLPTAAQPAAPPELRLRDWKGAAYRSLMRPGERNGHWVWASGLDQPGPWRGEAYAQCVNGTLKAALPGITVVE